MKKLTFSQLTFNENNTPVSEQFDDIYFSTKMAWQKVTTFSKRVINFGNAGFHMSVKVL